MTHATPAATSESADEQHRDGSADTIQTGSDTARAEHAPRGQRGIPGPAMQHT